MKKLDLHIHTQKSVSDHTFELSIDKLKEYVTQMGIDGIAITNHNLFDKEQFFAIQNELKDICVVLPGIEIDLGIKSDGHILCITTQDDIDDFSQKCDKISDLIKEQNDFVKYDVFKSIFTDLGKYLWIPHYDKDPILDKEIIKDMGDNIKCGEVGSVKKFIYNQNNPECLIPVYFSDTRFTADLQKLPLRQTYFDIDEISVDTIKRSLLSRTHVSLTEEEGHSLFYVLPDLKISTGLNVIVGGRSSGKTYTLNEIAQANDNVKYIKQFSLIEQDPETSAKIFADKIANKRNSFAEEYFDLFKEAVSSVKNISIKDDEAKIEQYITSLVKCAKETDRVDMFSKCALYNEESFPKRKLEGLEKLISATETLLGAREHRELIDKHIPYNSLVSLLHDLVRKYRQEKELSLKEKWVGDLVKDVKRALRTRSATTEISEVDFYECQLNRKKVQQFNKLASLVMQEEIISNQGIESFNVQAKKRAFKNAQELKDFSGRRNIRFSDIIDLYDKNPQEYLLALKEMDNIPDSDYYKYFAFIEYAVLNQYGFEVSGGERAEFNLLQEINDAYRYDLLLIDEPESSFDNIFLKEKVNHIIKELSKTMPVILVTHNNTVGASIKPDYLIHTKRIIDKDIRHERYCGLPSNKNLISNSGELIKNIDVMMDCLEAGQATYDERRSDYELLKD